MNEQMNLKTQIHVNGRIVPVSCEIKEMSPFQLNPIYDKDIDKQILFHAEVVFAGKLSPEEARSLKLVLLKDSSRDHNGIYIVEPIFHHKKLTSFRLASQRIFYWVDYTRKIDLQNKTGQHSSSSFSPNRSQPYA